MGYDFENCELGICWQDGNGNEIIYDTLPIITSYENFDYFFDTNQIKKIVFIAKLQIAKPILKENDNKIKLRKRNEQNEN